MKILIYIIMFAGLFLVFNTVVGILFKKWRDWQSKQVRVVADKLDDSFVFLEKRKIILIASSPLILAGIGFLILGNIWGGVIGFIIGLWVPAFVTSMARKKRVRDFQAQLVDTLMIFSSSLKGGLSFVQALEIVYEEMPPPISQEFGLVLKENKLGVSLEDSFENLKNRMPLEEVKLIVTSILVAKETGGDLTKVFSRLVGTIRDNVKLKEKIATLTLQGRLQGIIMACMPILFALFVYRQNPDHFSIMFETQTGRNLAILAVVLQILGIFFIKKISTLKT